MTRFEKSVLVLTLAVALAIPYLLESYALRVAASVLYFIILASSWNLLLGYAGVLSFAHAAFAGIGAYTTGLLSAGFLGDHVCSSLVKLDLLFNAGGIVFGAVCAEGYSRDFSAGVHPAIWYFCRLWHRSRYWLGPWSYVS